VSAYCQDDIQISNAADLIALGASTDARLVDVAAVATTSPLAGPSSRTCHP